MGSATKIDWCDSTWNPVTGCLHGCEYCYARRIAERFGGYICGDGFKNIGSDSTYVWELSEPMRLPDAFNTPGKIGQGRKAPYPFDFQPTFHRYKLDEPQHWKKPRNIFVVSMGDLFGDWVPDKWIKQVFEACEAAPQHRYLFLTKNPERYLTLARNGELPASENMWFGSSTPTPETPYFYDFRKNHRVNTFISIEPLLEAFGTWNFDKPAELPNWIIIGAETGNRKGKVVPQKEWVDEIAFQAERNHILVFMKESIRELMGEDFKQEFPWEMPTQ